MRDVRDGDGMGSSFIYHEIQRCFALRKSHELVHFISFGDPCTGLSLARVGAAAAAAAAAGALTPGCGVCNGTNLAHLAWIGIDFRHSYANATAAVALDLPE